MKKLLSALCALALALTAATPAMAWEHGRGGYRGGDGYYHGGHHGGHGDAVAAGVIGLALGAVIGTAIANDRPARCRYDCDDGYYAPPPPPYYGRGYRRSYYDNGYGYGYEGPRGTCFAREQQWDGYRGGYVEVSRPYPC